MSTSELYLTEEEIANFIHETKQSPQYFYGYEGQEYGVCPFLTMYIVHKPEDFENMAHHMIEVHEHLQGMIDSPYRMIWKDSTEVWFKAGDRRLPADLYEEVRKAIHKEQDFAIQATDMDSRSSSARWAIEAWVTNNTEMRYTTLKITFRHAWYLQHKAEWHRFMHKWISILQPDQCYSGFEIGSTGSGAMGSYEAEVMERICADYFYGLDIDHPGDMGFHYFHESRDGFVNVGRIGAGLRTPTWCFLLSPFWLAKLGLTADTLYQALTPLGGTITAIPYPQGKTAYWIQLGELALHPVEDGIPPLLAAASRLIRPVRCDDLLLSSLDPWDDDPNPRFNTIDGPRWMGRFDEDSDWPTPETRQPPQTPAAPARNATLSALPGEPCPKEGIWFAPHLGMQEVSMRQGDPMPGKDEAGRSGSVIWYWKA